MVTVHPHSEKHWRGIAKGQMAAGQGRISGRTPETGSMTKVRGFMVWRKEAEGQWRVAPELLNADPGTDK